MMNEITHLRAQSNTRCRWHQKIRFFRTWEIRALLTASSIALLGLLVWLVCAPQPERDVAILSKSKSEVISQALRSDDGSKLVVPFVKNLGQYKDAGVKYAASIFKGAVYVKDRGVVYSLMAEQQNADAGKESRKSSSYLEAMAMRDEPRPAQKVVAFEVNYGLKNLDPKGRGGSGAWVSYYQGADQQNWKTRSPSFNSVSLGEMWSNIEVALKAHHQNVEQLFIVKPSGKPTDIELTFKGIDKLAVRDNGELAIIHQGGSLL